MDCISSIHACFYWGLVDTYKLPSKQTFVYSDEYQVQKKIIAWNGRKNDYFLLHMHENQTTSDNGIVLCLKGGIS